MRNSRRMIGPRPFTRGVLWGQLRTEEAVEPLLDMQNRLDELGDDWYLEEFHGVFGLIGRPAIAALSAYLANRNNGEFSSDFVCKWVV